LLAGLIAPNIFHGLALPDGAEPGIKGGWLANLIGTKPISFHSEMGQTLWTATIAWTACFVLTILVSLATRRTKLTRNWPALSIR